jgi:hypothetical protein
MDQGLELMAKQPSEVPEQPGPFHMFNDGYIDNLLAEGAIHGRIRSGPSISEKAPLEVGAGRYWLAQLSLFRPLSNRQAPEGEESELLTLMNPGQQGLQVEIMNENRQPVQIRFVRGLRIGRSTLEKLDHFEARAGQATEWVISLPEEIAAAAETRLDAKASAGKPG